MKRLRRDSGFTLIELTMYGGLLGILLVILSEFFVTIVGTQLKTSVDAAMNYDSAYLLARTTYDIRRSVAIQSPAVGASASALVLTVEDGGTDKTYQYAVTNGNLMLTIDSQTTQLNSSNSAVTDFSVTRIGNSASNPSAKDTVGVQFTLGAVASVSGDRERRFSTTVSLR